MAELRPTKGREVLRKLQRAGFVGPSGICYNWGNSGGVATIMERSRDWMDQAEGDLLHARSDMQYTKAEAARLIDYAGEILRFCSDLLPQV